MVKERPPPQLYAPIYILPDYDKYEENKQCHVLGGKERTTLEWYVNRSMRKYLNWNLKDKMK